MQFGLQFEDVTEGQAQGQVSPANALEKSPGVQDKVKKKRPASAAPKTEMPPAASPLAAEPEAKAETKPETKTEPKPDKPSGGGEVVRLDRFRKK